ncbi:MAG TPA: O-antigen ligase family protein, partial [Anaerolineales bacterium]|nr:O-antigen ligase family protein [Anaerolineales bacterium]
MPRNARMAVLFSSLLHGGLVLAARYRLSYDAYNHMFFGDHYRRDWWSLWEPRWYTGFFVNSYPPLVHQLIGALSHLIGLDAAFGLILWITVALLPLAVYAFAGIFVGKASAGYAALGAACLPSVYLTAHIFGQLPTLAATVTALFGMTALNRYLREGGRLNGMLAVSLLGTVMAFHHGTLLLLPWLVLAIVLHLLLTKQVNWQILLTRLLPIGVFSALAMLVVIWPFWQWGRTQAIQTTIDHASRHNFFKDPQAVLFFFLPMYGPLVVIIPSAFWLARKRSLLGLGSAFFMLFLLGLGGTTPLPRLFFGNGWEWLTYDRFALWASLTLLPFFGMIVILLRQRFRGIRIPIFLPLAVFSLLVGLATVFKPLQPGAVDMHPIVSFLKQEDRAHWRYLTFGFGDQLALLSTLTTATTIDGSYHTARTLPELRTSGLAQIDTAFWFPHGIDELDPILQKAGDHGVRWGFVNVAKYIPVLERNGWIQIKTLQGGIQVWENPHAILPDLAQSPPIDPLASFSWGILPILSLMTSLALGSLRVWHIQAEKVLRGLYAFTVGLIPVALCFWYYQTISGFPHQRVYFTYTDALFFLADGLALAAVVLWLSTKIAQESAVSARHVAISFQPSTFILLTFLSILWSRDWRTSLYVSLHILLVLLLVLSLRDGSEAWASILLGFCAALSIEFITGAVEFLRQTTAFLAPLGLNWPGKLDPSVRGAVIVQLPGGESFLRAYGTLPHPNILGGFVLILLLGPIAFFLRKEKPNNLALLLLIPGVSLLALTFSRSAWLALVAFSVILIWKSRFFDRKRLAMVLAVLALSFAATLFPYRELVRARTTNTTSHSEEFSFIGRAWLNGEAVKTIREYPLTGVGIGSFILELARRAGAGYVVEPAHNVFLLAGAELGIPGLLLVIALFISFFLRLFKAQSPPAILAGATLMGLGVIGLFDHYLWTLAPGRLMLG